MCSISSDTGKYYYAIDNSDQETLTITGQLNVTIETPQNESTYYKGDIVFLNSTTKDENDDSVIPSVAWYDPGGQIATGENTTWVIPSSQITGLNDIRAEATKQYYTSDEKNVSIYVWGWSNVTFVSPSGESFQKNTDVNLVCMVEDANGSYPIENYPVNFYNDSEFISTEFTNSSGYANYTWNTGSLSGTIELKCNITDNATLYYNDSVAEDNTTIEIDVGAPNVENETRWHSAVIHTNELVNVTVDVTDDNLDDLLTRTLIKCG